MLICSKCGNIYYINIPGMKICYAYGNDIHGERCNGKLVKSKRKNIRKKNEKINRNIKGK